MIVPERRPIPVAREIFVKRYVAHQMQIAGGIAVKPKEVRQHRPETWSEQISLLCQQAKTGAAGIFKAAIIK